MTTPTLPELRAALDAATSDSERLAAMLELAESLLDNDLSQALALAAESLELAGRLANDHGMADGLYVVGMVNCEQGNYEQSMRYLQKAHALYERVSDREGVAKAMGNIGTIYIAHGERAQARELLQSALALSEELGDRKGIARWKGFIGMTLEYAEALEHYCSAVQLAEDLGDHTSVANWTESIGDAYKGMGEYDQALEYLQSALSMAEELGDRKRIVSVTASIAATYGCLGEFDKALEIHQSALTLAEEFDDRRNIARITGNIGVNYLRLGEYALALEPLQSARALAEELGNRNGVANWTGNIGIAYRRLGEYDQALEYLQSALTLAKELGEVGALWTGAIGSIYATKNFEGYNPARAEELLLRVLELLTEAGNKPHLLVTHHELASLYQQQGKWEQAHYHSTRYHELKEEVQSHEAHKKLQQMEHLKQIAEMEKQREIDKAEAKAAELRTQLLQSQLEHKQQQLASTTISLARQSELLHGFRNDLRGMMQNTSDMTQIINELKRKLKEIPDEAIDWPKFEAEFELSHPEFRAKLIAKHPDLTKTEARICSLLRLKLISTDIAQLLCVTDRNVEFHRLNIRKKLGLKRGEDLAEALAGI